MASLHLRRLALIAGLSLLGAICASQPSAEAAVDPNARPATQFVLNYIHSIRDQGMVLSAQTASRPWLLDDLSTNPYNDKMSEITRVNQMTGKFPAMIGLDFLNCQKYVDHGNSTINLAKSYAARGGLIQFQYHEGNPRSYNPDDQSFYVGGGNPAPLSAGEWNDLLNNNGSGIHQNWQHHMDLVAGWLTQLQNAGVTVIWRPYHEADGSWFWWGGNAGNFNALWRMQFNYLTNVKGLHNLIWTLSSPTAGFYPGPTYVDIAGMDVYANSQTDASFSSSTNAVRSYAFGQPIALTETGLLPTSNYIQQLGYAWAAIWGGSFLDNGYYQDGGFNPASGNTLQQVQAFYNDARTINLDRVAVPTASLSTAVWYKIVNQNSGKVLAVQNASGALGAQVQQYDDNGTADHNWRFIASGNGTYRIANQNSNLVVGVAGAGANQGDGAVQWSDNTTADHNWSMVPLGNGFYHIVNANSGLLLGVAGASTANSANVVQWGDNGSTDHNWKLVPISSPLVSGHVYHIVNSHSGLFIDNPNGTNVAGTFLQQFVNTYSPAQEWIATNVTGNKWTFQNVAGGLGIDNYNWSTSAGTRIDEWYYGAGNGAQQWALTAVGDGTYKLTSSGNLLMEIQGAAINNGGFLGQWYDNGNACQHWTFEYLR